MAVSLSRQQQVPGTGIYFSIQGNILANEDVVTAAMTTFAETKGTLADRVMAAMETADARGGDRRCTCETKPIPAATAACENKTSHVAYILRADAADKTGASFNDGQYAMYVAVTNDDITAGRECESGQDAAAALRRVEEGPSTVTPEEQQEVRRLIDAHEHTLQVCRACAETTRDLAWEVKRGSVPSAEALAATLAEVERVLDDLGKVEVAIAEMKAALW